MAAHWHMVSIEKKVDDYPDDWIGCRYKAAILKCVLSRSARENSVVLSLQDWAPVRELSW